MLLFKKQKEKFYLIKGTIYPYDVLLSTEEDDEKVFEYIEKEKQYTLSSEEKEVLPIRGDGRAVQLRNGAIVIRLRPKKTQIGIDICDLVHELSHATYFILSKVGVQHTDSSDESYAYVLGYLMQESLRFFDS